MNQIARTVPDKKMFEAFCGTFPEYKTTASLDVLRAKDFRRLDDKKHIYLDFTGAGQYGQTQLNKHMKLLSNHTYGNPHSDNPTSRRSTKWVEMVRDKVLAYFNASPEEYTVIFTANASGALKIVGESYPFSPGGQLLQLVDNHNSVNGIREFAKVKGATVELAMSDYSDLLLNEIGLREKLELRPKNHSLFAYPAQSNFSGVQHSLKWIKIAQNHGWDVLLDVAAFVPTNTLDLGKYKPDYVSLSFYKMFGWPTGVGCLLARKKALAKLKKPSFAGGTIWAVSALADWHVLAENHEAFEDGTLNYLNLLAIPIGLEYLERITVDKIHTRVMCLTGWLLQELRAMRHKNGAPLVEIYGPITAANRGPTVAFNFLDKNGFVVDERIVEREAKKWKISLRAGCFCNPGTGEIAFKISKEKLLASHTEGTLTGYDEYLELLGLQSAGAIRISLGHVSNFNDVHTFLTFAKTFCDAKPNSKNLTPRTHC